jgi:hypothetical protein
MKPEKNHLVGGFNPLKNSQLGLLFPTEWKKKSCSKPPSSHGFCFSQAATLQDFKASTAPATKFSWPP